MIDLKLCTHSSNRLVHKSVPKIFPMMSYLAFAAILWHDLVLTAHVFCVALHQSFGIELFDFEIYGLYICETPHKK